MKKGTQKLLLTAAIAGGAWWIFLGRHRRRTLGPAVRTVQALPTDSMQPGTLAPAAQGLIKDGDSLSVIGPA